LFNLLVHSSSEAWEGDPHITFEMSRCVREYTDSDITERYGSLSDESAAALMALPAIFAYEQWVEKDPRIGRLTRIEKRTNRQEVLLGYELFEWPGFLSNKDLWSMEGQLDLGKWECNRTHWAVKNVDLPRELAVRGIALPHFFGRSVIASTPAPIALTAPPAPRVNVRTHTFDVAFSFPGEYRPTVEAVVRETMALLGAHSCFYDFNYQGQLAVPSLDVLLQEIYGVRSRLLVVFIGSDYQRKHWPGIEWRAIRTILNERQHERIMYVKMDDGAVEGIHAHDGYIDARRFSAPQIAGFIAERVELLPPAPPRTA
jgi:hypothetical protein